MNKLKLLGLLSVLFVLISVLVFPEVPYRAQEKIKQEFPDSTKADKIPVIWYMYAK